MNNKGLNMTSVHQNDINIGETYTFDPTKIQD